MYDTVTVWFGAVDQKCLKQIISVDNEVIDKESGEIKSFGRLRNLRLKFKGSGVSVNGSLAKFAFGNNIETLNFDQTVAAIEEISDLLKIHPKAGKVYRLDFGTNFILNNALSEYFCLFGEAQHFQRHIFEGTGINYVNCRRTLAFYDKLRQTRKKKETVPDNLKKKFLLRYEMRMLNRLKAQLKLSSDLTFDKLCDRKFYHSLAQRWRDEYHSIKKLKKLKPKATCLINDVPSLKDQLSAMGVEYFGGINDLLAVLERAKKSNEIDRQQFYRIRKCVFEICNNPVFFEANENIKELDLKIDEFVKSQL